MKRYLRINLFHPRHLITAFCRRSDVDDQKHVATRRLVGDADQIIGPCVMFQLRDADPLVAAFGLVKVDCGFGAVGKRCSTGDLLTRANVLIVNATKQS